MKGFTKAVIGILVAVFVLGAAAQAQFAKPQEAIAYRQAAMFLIATHFKRLAAVVQGKADYDKAQFAENARTVAFLATLPWEAMTAPGSARGKTRMTSAVFENPTRFKENAASLERSTAKLAELALAGDFDVAKRQFGVVAGNCKECHSEFRSR